MIAITICATESYTYAMTAQARRVHAAILHAGNPQCAIILSGGDCLHEFENLYNRLLPSSPIFRVKVAASEHVNYKPQAQLAIAQMRTAAFDEARRIKADFCWSLDSDVLPQQNALAVSMQALELDNGYYSIAACPYPSQGGGDFLNGRGTEYNPILPDIYENERIIPPDLQKRIESHASVDQKGGEEWKKERDAIAEEIKKCEPKGDVFFLNSSSGVNPFSKRLRELLKDQPEAIAVLDAEMEHWKPTGYKRRGWHSAAYPAIGRGAILPTDWCGFGCTLMNSGALGLAQFDGYTGEGTEDLYVVFKRWFRAGMRIASIPHSPCDHVIRKDGGYQLLQAYHESSGECVGHLRMESRPWVHSPDQVASK